MFNGETASYILIEDFGGFNGAYIQTPLAYEIYNVQNVAVLKFEISKKGSRILGQLNRYTIFDMELSTICLKF